MAETATRYGRNSTIEVLRIICMLLVIAHHCVVHGGAMGMDPCGNKVTASLVLPGGKIAFTCFVAISMWFLVDQSFRGRRFIRTWLEVLFYSVLMAVVSALLGAQLNGRDWLGALLPIGGNTHGFAATYLIFYLLLPLLSRAASGLSKKQVVWVILVLLYAQVVEPVLALLGLADISLHPFTSEITLFALCYFISLYLRRWSRQRRGGPVAPALVALLTWLLISALTIVQWMYPVDTAPALLSALAANESSILYIVGGFALFLCFNNLPPTSLPFVNRVASTTFGILLMHDSAFFRYILWEGIIRASSWWYESSYLLHLAGITVAVFCTGAVVDFFRRVIFEKPVLRSAAFSRVSAALDSIWSD